MITRLGKSSTMVWRARNRVGLTEQYSVRHSVLVGQCLGTCLATTGFARGRKCPLHILPSGRRRGYQEEPFIFLSPTHPSSSIIHGLVLHSSPLRRWPRYWRKLMLMEISTSDAVGAGYSGEVGGYYQARQGHGLERAPVALHPSSSSALDVLCLLRILSHARGGLCALNETFRLCFLCLDHRPGLC